MTDKPQLKILKIYKSKKNQQKWPIFSQKNILDVILGF